MSDLDAMLAACLSFDNQARKAAEKALKQLSSHNDYVPELCKRLEAGDAQVRQLAAVLVRKAVGKHYPKLAPEVQGQMRALLLQRVVSEPLHPVRRAIADVVGAVARDAVPQNRWPELLQFLQQCASSQAAEHREVAMLLFASLMETLGEFMAPHVGGVIASLTAALGDASPAVQAAALAAVEPLLPLVCTQDHVRAFHGLVSAALAAAERAAAAATAPGAAAAASGGGANGPQEILILICQVLLEAAEFPAPLLQPALPAVLEMALALAGARGLENDTREQALQLLHWVARYKPKQLARQKALLKRAVDALCGMMCEPLPEDYDDASELPPQRMAAQALDLLALHLPGAQVFPAVWQFCGAAAPSPDPNQRHAAALALTVVAEGCADPLRRKLPEALGLLLGLLRDGDEGVRGAAAFAVGQMAEYVQPEVLDHHAQVLPALLEALTTGAPSKDLLERLIYALDAYVENMSPEAVAPYVDPLMRLLGAVLGGGAGGGGGGAQKEALSCLASLVAAAGKGFTPYAPTVLPVLQHFMSLPGQDNLPARCKAVECVGMLADSLGPHDPVVGPAIPGIVEAVISGFAVDSPELREYSHLALANLSAALKEGFAPYVPRALALAAASCEQPDGDLVRGGGGGGGGDASEDIGSEDSDEDDDEDSDDDGDAGGRGFRVRTGVVDEKAAATHAVGAYADACAPALAPHAEAAAALLRASCQHLHEEVRAAAHEALPKLVLAVHRGAAPPPAAGGTPAPAAPATPQVRAMAGGAVQLLLDPLDTDPDKPAVAAALSGLAALVAALGSAALEPPQLEAAAAAAAAVLKGEAACQQEEEDDDDGPAAGSGGFDEDDGGEEDEELISAAADLLPALAAAVGPAAYAPVFLSAHLGPLLARLRPQQPAGVRGVAAGALAEVCEKLGVLAAPAAEQALPLLTRELRGEDAINRQNAAFACGILCHTCPQQAAPHVPGLLQALHPLFQPEEDAGARDNAAGAVGRMLLALGGALPVEQIVPVLVGALPLQEDLEETAPVCAALCQLLAGDAALQARVAPQLPAIVAAFGRVAVQEAAPMAARQQAARALSQLQDAVGPLLASLPADQQQALQQLAASG
ncbi:MAG: armadillo-type protein [Monoraphidium minutum]|nr:MAG: armadillo-type protein [Monoraphidium minutum]